MHMKKLLIILICLLSGLALYGQEAIFIGAASIADPFFTDTVYFDYDSVYISNGGDTMKFVVDDVEGLRIVNTGSDSRVYIYGDLVLGDTLFFAYDSMYITSDTDSMKFVIDDVEALRLINEGTQSTIRLHNGALLNNIRSTNLTITEDTTTVDGDLDVTGTATAPDVIVSNLATSTTTVLTPTSTGQLDTLETTDLATADFTVTGDWTFDNVVIDSADIDTANIDYLYVSEKALFDSTVTVGNWGYTGEHIVIPETSSNTNPLLGNYGMVNYTASANKVLAGLYSRMLLMTANQTNSSTMVGIESQFRLRDVNIANGVHAGLWAYAEQSGTSALSGTGTFDAISACVESGENFTVGATNHVTGITVDASINALATIDASANYSGIYIKSNGKDWFNGLYITGATNAIKLQSGATIDNTEPDTLILTETVVKVKGDATVSGALTATGNITGATMICLHTAATYVFSDLDSCKNVAHFNSDADVIDFTLPGAEAGLVMMFYDIGGGVITIDPVDGTDTIYLNGTSVGAGDAIDSPGAVGDFICLMAIDDTRWVTVGRSGTWIDGGAD